MQTRNLIELLNLKIYSEGKDVEVNNAYTSDLLSIVLTNAPKDSIWITIQKHINIVAVASLKEINVVIITEGGIPEEEVVKKAKNEKIWLLGSRDDSFTVSGKIFEMLQDEKIHG
jgi:hypothetical protein